MTIDEHRLNALLWAVWGQGIGRLIGFHRNGDFIADANVRLARYTALMRPIERCPHWPEYRATTLPILEDEASQLFSGRRDVAMELLFDKLQAQDGIATIQKVARHPDLDFIVEDKIWPWLEEEQ